MELVTEASFQQKKALNAEIRTLIAKDIFIRQLPDVVRDKTIADLSSLSLRVVIEKAEALLPEDTKDEFRKLLDLPDTAKRDSFLDSHVADFWNLTTGVVTEHLTRFKAALA